MANMEKSTPQRRVHQLRAGGGHCQCRRLLLLLLLLPPPLSLLLLLWRQLLERYPPR
eukprot:COSAG01_NODE_3167_length_6474_cov_2.587765_2_plen_57_part_00